MLKNSIRLLGRLDGDELEALLDIVRALIKAAGGTDISSYAPGRINAWNGPKADLRYKGNFFQAADWWCPELHQFCERLLPGYHACLITYSGDGQLGKGIALHSDQSYAAFKARTINLQTDPDATTEWFYGQRYPGMGYSREQTAIARSREDFLADRGEDLCQFELCHGDVIEFNCKNPHAAHPGPRRYSINLWQAANTERAPALAAWQQIVSEHGRSGGGRLIETGIEPVLPEPMSFTQAETSRLQAPAVVRWIRSKEYYEAYMKPQSAQFTQPKLQDYFSESWAQYDVRRAGQLLQQGYRCSIGAVRHQITRHDLFLISGGQDGADQAGLEAAQILGLPTGGVAPHRWLVSTGTAEALLRSYGLIEGPPAKSDVGAYRIRTVLNAAQADGTIIFGSVDAQKDRGSYLTLQLAKWYEASEGKSWCHVPLDDLKSENLKATAEAVRSWLLEENIRSLNVAGNRSFKLQEYDQAIVQCLMAALKEPLR